MTWKAYVPLAILLVLAGVGAYFLLIDGGAPQRRPDLIQLPDDAPEAPRGYPTLNAAYLAYAAGRVDMLNPKAPVELPASVRAKKDVPYIGEGDAARMLDVYYPANASTPAPMLLFIHGGGWSGGHRRDYTLYTIDFAQKGYVAATVSYRLSGVAKFPAAVEDVKCAVRWLRAHAEEFGGDPNLIVTIGGSAGGHLSLMAGYTNDDEFTGECQVEASAKVAGVIDLYGPADVTVENARFRKEVTSFLGTTWDEAPELFSAVSPLTHLDKDDPPTFVLHGTIDDVVGVEQSDMLVERLRELGVTHWYDRLDGYPHTMDIVQEVNDRTQWLVDAFVQRVVIPNAQSSRAPAPVAKAG